MRRAAHLLDDHVHLSWAKITAMPRADAEPSADQSERVLAIAERHEHFGNSEAAIDIAMSPDEMLPVVGDLSSPSARAIGRQIENLTRNERHAQIVEQAFY